MEKKRLLSFALAMSLMLSSALTASAEIPNGSLVVGNKAYDLQYASKKDAAVRKEIQDEILKGGAIYVKAFAGQWVLFKDGVKKVLTPAEVTANIPELTYKDKDGKVSSYEKGDGDMVESNSLEIISID